MDDNKEPQWAVAILMVQHDAGPYSLRRRETVLARCVRAANAHEAAARASNTLVESGFTPASGWAVQTWDAVEVEL